MISKRTPSSIIMLLGFLFYFLFNAHAQYFNRIHQIEGVNNHSVIFNNDTIIFMGEGHLRTNFTDRYIDTYYLFKTDLAGNTLQERMFGFVHSNTNYDIFDTYNYNRLYKHYNKLIVTGFGRDSVDVGLPSPYYSNPLFVSMHGLNTDSILTHKWRNYSTTNPVYYIGHSVVSIDSNKIGVWLQASLNREVNNDYTTPDTAWLYILNTAHNLDIIRAIPFTPTLPGGIFVDVGNTAPNSAIINNNKNILVQFSEYDVNRTAGSYASNYFLVDTMGNVLLHKRISATENTQNVIGKLSFALDNDGSFIVSGIRSLSDNTGRTACLFQKLDNTTLNPTMWVWGDTVAPIGGALAPNGFKKVVQSPTGYYYTIHDAYASGTYATGAVISKFSSTGQLVWKHNYTPANLPADTASAIPRINAAHLFDLALHPNGNLLVACGQAGITNNIGSSPRGWHGWILGVDTMGCEVQNCFTGVSEVIPTEGRNLVLYPNPAHDVIHITITPSVQPRHSEHSEESPTNNPNGISPYGVNDEKNLSIIIYNTEGQAMQLSPSLPVIPSGNDESLTDNNTYTINIARLPKGLYFLKIGNNSAKFVKL
jgi:hypothetical protein